MKVLVTPRSFGKTDPEAYDILESAGFEIVRNSTNGIMNEEQLKTHLADCDGVIIGVDPLTKDVLAAAPKLKAIAKYGVGLDNIDLDYCKERGIKVSKTVGANSDAVADFAFALILAVARQIVTIDKNCRQGNWKKLTSIDVSGQTIGILGMGAIGRGVAMRAKGFNMKVLGYDVLWDDKFAENNNIIRSSLEEIYREADFISLHLPLIPETQNIIGKEQLKAMKGNAILINTARGGLIDENALYDALKLKQIYGAGIDAFSQEPLNDIRWYDLENIVIGSHAAASTIGSTEKMGRIAAQNIVDAFA